MSSNRSEKFPPINHKLRIIKFCLLGLCALIFATTIGCEEPEREFKSKTRFIVEDYAERVLPIGLSVSVFIGGEWEDVILGRSDIDSGDRVTEQTLFQLAAGGHHIIAFVFATALEENVISEQTALQSLLPGRTIPMFEDQQITLLHLASHSSGFPNTPTNLPNSPDYDRNNPFKNYGIDSLFTFVENFELSEVPGTTYQLSNTGYALLAIALENAYALPINQVYEEKVSQVFGLTNSEFELSEEQAGLVATPYSASFDELPLWEFDALTFALGYHSNLSDMKRILNQFLSPNAQITPMVNFMEIPRFAQSSIGWNGTNINGSAFYFSGGQANGHEVFFGYSPNEEFALVILTNSQMSDRGSRGDLLFLANQLLDARFSN